jgi:hypothetical protein
MALNPASDIPPDKFRALFKTAGELVIAWGLAEAALVSIIAILYQRAGGRHVADRIPVSFKRRRKFLRLCAHTIAPLAEHAPAINRILDELVQIATIRNALAHGAISAYDLATDVYTFTLLGTDDVENIHRVNSVSCTLLSMRGAVIDLQRLTREMGALAEHFMDAFVRK